MVAQDNENRITDSSISISKGCTVSEVPDEYVHLCENKILSIFTVTFSSVSISLPCGHYHKFMPKEAVHSTTLQLSLCSTWKGNNLVLHQQTNHQQLRELDTLQGFVEKNLVLWQHLFYSYHIDINEAAHVEERDRAQKRGKFSQNQG